MGDKVASWHEREIRAKRYRVALCLPPSKSAIEYQTSLSPQFRQRFVLQAFIIGHPEVIMRRAAQLLRKSLGQLEEAPEFIKSGHIPQLNSRLEAGIKWPASELE